MSLWSKNLSLWHWPLGYRHGWGYQVPRSSTFWFWRRFLKGFYNIWAWPPSCHVTRTIWTNFRSRVLRSLHMKFEFNWPSGFRGEGVWKCWWTDNRQMDGRRCHWYTISSIKKCDNHFHVKVMTDGLMEIDWQAKSSIARSFQSRAIIRRLLALSWSYDHKCHSSNQFRILPWVYNLCDSIAVNISLCNVINK